MYHPTTRVLTVLELLQSHQRLSGPELARRLEVDVRTARRYITMLQDMGIPIEAERGRYGAYRLRPGFKLPPLMFSEDEALALTLGLLSVRHLGLVTTAPAVEGALAKVERVLPQALRLRVQALQETLMIEVPTRASTPASEIVGLFSEAASQGRRLLIAYRSGQGEASEREIDPYGLVSRAGLWYAVGFCHLRGGLRVFRLDRVQSAELREARFSRPPDFDSLAYLIDSIARMSGTWTVEVLLHTNMECARQAIPATLGTLSAEAEGVLLRCFVEGFDWLARFLAGLPMRFSVRSPDELRARLRELAAQLMANAEQG